MPNREPDTWAKFFEADAKEAWWILRGLEDNYSPSGEIGRLVAEAIHAIQKAGALSRDGIPF